MNADSGSAANGAARRTSASSSSTCQVSRAVIATSCCASTSSGLDGTRSASIAPARIRSVTTADCTRSPRYLGKTTPGGDRAHLVARPAHALEPGGDRGRRLDLDHQVHRAHVDAQLKAGGGHHRRQPARLQVLLDQRPLLLGDRAVVGPGQQRRGAPGRRPNSPISSAGEWCSGSGSPMARS